MESGPQTVFSKLLSIASTRGSAFLVLVDPDKTAPGQAVPFAELCEEARVDGFLIGGSLSFAGSLDQLAASMKKASSLPVILFPGNACQISGEADAILFLSLLSSRNAQYLVGEQVKAATVIHRLSMEVIPTAYLLVESGSLTSVQFVTQSLPIPRDKSDIAVAHALAGKYLGMRLIYLEAGSGARMPVPPEMVSAVSAAAGLPVSVGGGVRSPEEAGRLARSGASFVVIGNALEKAGELRFLKELSEAIHYVA